MIRYTIHLGGTVVQTQQTATIENAIAELVRLQSVSNAKLTMRTQSLSAKRLYHAERGALGVVKVYDPFNDTLTSYRLDRGLTAVVAERVELV